jgi:HTH-type transcriptional regulator/antitoxin HigA
MKVPIITNDAEHTVALERVTRLVEGNQESDFPEIEALSLLIENYEKRRWPIEASDPISVLQFVMEQQQLTQSGLAVKLEFTRHRMSEVLNRKRPLTLGMIRRIVAKLGLPSDVLVREYSTDKDRETDLLSR